MREIPEIHPVALAEISSSAVEALLLKLALQVEGPRRESFEAMN